MKMTARDRILLIFLAVLLIGVCYYMFFLKPLQADLQSIATQSAETDQAISVSTAKLNSMKSMQDELDEIFSRPEEEITEIAPYDNAKVVMSQLNGILSASENYSLNFKDPDVQKDGTVRRVVTMSFDCKDYASAKVIIKALSSSHWRCLINNIAVNGVKVKVENVPVAEEPVEGAEAAEGAESVEATEATPVVTEPEIDAMKGAVTIQATITFFESTKIAG